MLNKKIVFSIFFIVNILICSNNTYSLSESIQKNIIKNSDYIEKQKEENLREAQINFLLDAIRKKNNNIVFSYLENSNYELHNKNGENELKTFLYGPNIDMLSEIDQSTYFKVNVNAKNRLGYTPIIVAIESQNNEVLEKLIELGANLREEHPVFGKLTLHTACYYENIEAVKLLLLKDKSLLNVQSGTDGWLALQDATLKNNPEIVRVLLENGANPLLTDKKGGTAMDMATEFGKGEIVKLLRDKIKQNRRY